MRFSKNQPVFTRVQFTSGTDVLPKNSPGVVQDSFVVNNNAWYVVNFGSIAQPDDWSIDEPNLSDVPVP